MKLVLSAPLTKDPEAMIPPNWFKQLANIHLKLADYGSQEHFDNFKLSRQLMEKFVRYRLVDPPLFLQHSSSNIHLSICKN